MQDNHVIIYLSSASLLMKEHNLHKSHSVFSNTLYYKETMNHLIMIILNLFFLSPISANICDFPGGEDSFEQNYFRCQTYLMKWSVAALWMIAISLFIIALTVSMNITKIAHSLLSIIS